MRAVTCRDEWQSFYRGCVAEAPGGVAREPVAQASPRVLSELSGAPELSAAASAVVGGGLEALAAPASALGVLRDACAVPSEHVGEDRCGAHDAAGARFDAGDEVRGLDRVAPSTDLAG
jgi:hypothetical protein